MILILITSITACSRIPSKEEEQEAPTELPLKIETKTTPAPTSVPAQTTETEMDVVTEIDLSQYFEGINGCAVFYNPNKQEYQIYNKKLSEHRSSPCSTFKIISSLLGLEQGVIKPEDSVFKWNGTTYWKSEWNKDIDFMEAFQFSCVWYFREVINQLGEKIVQENLDQLNYGNCDISDWEGKLNANNSNRDLTGFWIESSLKISPKEQVEVLSSLFEGEKEFSEDSLVLLKKAMLDNSSSKEKKIYGKTGTGMLGDKYLDAWYVGMFEQKEDRVYFALRLDEPDNKEVSGQKAKEILLNIVKEYQFE